MKMLPVLFLGILLLVGCGDPDLDDPKTRDKIAGDALASEKLQERGPDGEELSYAPNSQIPYTGWVKSMHENGQVSILAHYKDGEKDGLYTSWHENGQKEMEGHYKEGEMDGLQTLWNKNGQKWGEGHWKDGKLHGLNATWHENGQKKKEGYSKDGKEDGLWTRWHENGQKESETHYKDGKEDGLRTAWHENGQKKKEGHYKDGKQDGLYTGWHENGQKEWETHCKDGKEDGLSTGWYENGQKRVEAHFKDGKKDGLETEWDEDGKVVNKVRRIGGVGWFHENSVKAFDLAIGLLVECNEAAHPNQLNAVVRDAERVLQKLTITDVERASDFSLGDPRTLSWEYGAAGETGYMVIKGRRADHTPFRAYFVKTDGGLRLDWMATHGMSDIAVPSLVKEATNRSTLVRCWVGKQPQYDVEKEHASTHSWYVILEPTKEEFVWAYAPAKSELDERLRDILSYGRIVGERSDEVRATIRLAKPTVGFRENEFEITELTTVDWVAP